MRNTHNAKTFKPYNPAELVGDLNPTTPEPPKDGPNCGVMGQIMLVAIAAVVAAVTAGAGLVAIGAAQSLSAALTTIASGGLLAAAGSVPTAIGIGAVAGAAGSIASQSVGVATGIQEKFSWNAVGLAAIAAADHAGVLSFLWRAAAQRARRAEAL